MRAKNPSANPPAVGLIPLGTWSTISKASPAHPEIQEANPQQHQPGPSPAAATIACPLPPPHLQSIHYPRACPLLHLRWEKRCSSEKKAFSHRRRTTGPAKVRPEIETTNCHTVANQEVNLTEPGVTRAGVSETGHGASVLVVADAIPWQWQRRYCTVLCALQQLLRWLREMSFGTGVPVRKRPF